MTKILSSNKKIRRKKTEVKGTRWQLVRRQEFIETCLFWEGRINRRDLVDKFGISVPQATDDIAQYIKRAPSNIAYDAKEKAYLITATYKPEIIQPEADRYLMQLRAVHSGLTRSRDLYLNDLPSFDIVPIPRRPVKTEILRQLLKAIRQRWAITITYQSMNSPRPAERDISPHSIAFDGYRWHTRAYCHKDKIFKDFVIGRILKIGKHHRSIVDSYNDLAWNKILTAILVPNPKLPPAQQMIIAMDYGMEHGRLYMQLRASFVYYFERLMGRYVMLGDNESATQIEIENLSKLKSVADALAHTRS
ncbi:MAG: helix-turn-helix transcriptional regulator [Gammaproteobacteria bacterium]